jgi:hypothetical protein
VAYHGTVPMQEMPRWMEQILHLLAQARKPGRVRVAECLLGMGGDARDVIAEHVTQVRALQQRQGRPRPLSTFGEIRLTVSMSQKGSYRTTFVEAREHAIAVMTLQNESDRVMIWLQYSEQMVLEDVKWAILTPADAGAIDAEKLSKRVERLRASRDKLDPSDVIVSHAHTPSKPPGSRAKTARTRSAGGKQKGRSG